MINRVTLTGRLVREVEVRYTQSGKAVGSLTLAVNRPFTNQNNEREADFPNCTIWGKSAENLANFTHKGSLIGVDGRIQTRNYENQQGQKVYVTEVIVENFSLLEPKQNNDNQSGSNSYGNSNNSKYGGQNNQSSGGYNAPTNNRSNNYNNQGTADPFDDTGNQIDISDDDLPF